MNPDDTLQESEEVEVEGEVAIPARGLPSPTQPEVNNLPHFRSETEGEHVVPTVSIDYFFMGPSGQEEAQGVLLMLAVKSHESRMTFAHVVERKGPVDSTTRRLVADLDWLGLR